MAFRPPREQEQGVPSLGYRLSSNRQPGIEQSNNMMPQYSNPIGRGSRPMPPQDMPMPQYERPIGRPGMGNYQNMGRQSTDPRERYIANTQGGHPNMSQFGYPMQDRGPITMDPIMTMLDDPQAMLDFNYATDLENFQEDNIMNQLMIGEKFDPMLEAEELKRNPPYDGSSIMELLGLNRGGIASLRR